MTAKHLVLGLDGADLSLLHTLGPEQLPHLHALMRRGAHAHLESVQPPATLPNWTTFLTGVDPGVHGVFDFTLRRGYGVRFTAGTVREAPTWMAALDRLGLRCACVGFPAMYPPEQLENGIFVSGWDAPVAFEADRSFVWPPALHGALTRRFGPLRFDSVDEFAADSPGWHRRLGGQLAERVATRTELASFLLGKQAWDVFAFYFGESDTAAHHLWSLFDEGSPRRPRGVDGAEADGLPRVYRALDAAVGRLVREAGPDVEVTVVSDHGSGGASDQVFYLNRALAEAGLLRFRPGAGGPSLGGVLKGVALYRLPQGLRERLFRAGSAALPSWLESRTRFASIDMSHSFAFSDELNYFPAVHLNLRGREPRGRVDRADAARVRQRVRDALLALRNPWTGRPVVRVVHDREALYRGPHVERAPDLLLELHLTGGYSYNLMPSASAPPVAGAFRRLAECEWLGKKGRSLPGSHRSHGLWIAAGPRVDAVGQVPLAMADAAACVLTRIGVRIPTDMPGRVPAAIHAHARHALPEVPLASGRPRGDRAQVEARLRALGYID